MGPKSKSCGVDSGSHVLTVVAVFVMYSFEYFFFFTNSFRLLCYSFRFGIFDTQVFHCKGFFFLRLEHSRDVLRKHAERPARLILLGMPRL